MIEASLATALALHRQGDIREAEALYRSILVAAPDHADARHLLGVAAVQTGRVEEAVRLACGVLVLMPGSAEAQGGLAQAMIAAGRPLDATLILHRAIRLKPGLAAVQALLRQIGAEEATDAAVPVAMVEDGDRWRAALLRALDGPAPLVAFLSFAGDARMLERVASLAQTLGVAPDADIAIQGVSGLPDGPVPAGLWLARLLERPVGLWKPPVAVVRRDFLRRVLIDDSQLPPDLIDASVLWSLVAAAGRPLHVSFAGGEEEPPSGEPSTDAEVRALVWLRGRLGGLMPDSRPARALRRALTLRLAADLCLQPWDDVAPRFGARTPVGALHRLVSSLPSRGMMRAARSILRSGVAAAAAALAAGEPRSPRAVHGLRVGSLTIIPVWAAATMENTSDGWCYLGRNAVQLMTLRRTVLNAIPFVPIEPRLQEVGLRHRAAFITAMSDLLMARPNRLASMLADLTPDTSFLFQDLCYVLTVLDMVAAPETRRLLVVVEDLAILRMLNDVLAPDHAAPERSSAEAGLDRLWWRFWTIFRRAAKGWHRQLTALDAVGLPTVAPSDGTVLMVSYLDRNGLDAGGRWHDRYFGALPDWLRSKGHPVTWLWFHWARDLTPAQLSALKRDQGPGFLMEEFVGWRGVVAAIIAKFNAWRAAPWLSLRIAGRDFSPLLTLELTRAVNNPGDIDRLMFTRIGRALAERGVRPDRIIYPFENHGWEKMLCAGVRRHLPHTRLIGYQHATYSPFYLGFSPDPRFWKTDRRPDRVVAMGQKTAATMRDDGYPEGMVMVGGALRFAHLFDPPGSGTTGQESAVLAVFPTSLLESLDLLLLLVEGLGERQDIPVLLKPHPATISVVRPYLLNTPSHFHLFEGSMCDAIARCFVGVYSTGTTALEIMAHGKPVIAKWPTGGFPYLDLPAGSWFVRYAATAAELRGHVDAYRTLSQDERALIARQAKETVESWFESPTAERLSSFLE